MSATDQEKHVTLPGIAHNQQDVYETPDPPPSSEAKKYEDDSRSEVVDKLDCGVGKSYDTFKGKAVDNQNTDFSDEVRQGFGSLPDFVPKENGATPEDMFERYKRLKQEVTDLLADMERLKTATGEQPSDQGASDSLEDVGGAVSVEELKVLQQQLGDAGINKILGEGISPAYGNLLTKNLLSKLEAAGKVTSDGTSTASSSDASIYELYHKPETTKFTHLSKLSQLEERLAELESVIGMEHPKPSVVSGGLDGEKKCMATRLSSLHSKVALLDQSHVAAADMRLQGLLNSIKQVKKEQTLLQAAESQSKVSEIYNAVQKWDSVATLLPDLIDRLHALKDLHQQAAEFSNSVAQIGTEQAKITSQLNTDQNLLSQLKKTFAANMTSIEANCKALESRMAALMKK